MKESYMKLSTIFKITISIIVLLFLVYLAYKAPKGNGYAGQSESRYESVKKQDLVQRVTIAGNVEPEKKTIVTAPFSGYVKKLFVHVGQKVNKNDPLVSVVQSLQSVDPIFPLRAPFDGTVVAIQKQEGEFVKQDDPKDFILRIDSLGTLYVISNVPEIDMIKIKKGQETIIKASAILDKSYKGKVEDISLASKLQDDWRGNSKVEYPTKIKIEDADSLVKPGMSTIVDIITLKKENVLVLPHEYILREGEEYFVLLKNGSKTKITVGIQNEAFFEIVSGVSEGEVVKQIDFMELLNSGK